MFRPQRDRSLVGKLGKGSAVMCLRKRSTVEVLRWKPRHPRDTGEPRHPRETGEPRTFARQGNRAPPRDRGQFHGSSAGSTVRLKDVGAQSDTPLRAQRGARSALRRGAESERSLEATTRCSKSAGGRAAPKSAGFPKLYAAQSAAWSLATRRSERGVEQSQPSERCWKVARGDKPLLKKRGGRAAPKSAGFHTDPAATPRWRPPKEYHARAVSSSP